MSELWFSSDTHFFHKNIKKFCPDTRNGDTIEEMNELMIQEHNKRVKPNDTYYHLGDFSFGNADQTSLILSRMNGVKRIVLGNHDQVIKKFANVAAFFEEIHNYKKIRINNQQIVLMHYPIESWDGQYRGSIHLHGHIHGDTHRECRILRNRFDVGIDTRREKDMAPYHIDEVLGRIKDRDALLPKLEYDRGVD